MANDVPKLVVLAKGYDTPIGGSYYSKLFRPETKFDPEGKYEASIILGGDDAAKVINEIDAYAAEYQKQIKKKAPMRPYTDVLDEEGNETGDIRLKATLKATSKFGPRRPAVYDSSGKQLTSPVDVGNGSQMRLKVNVKGYNTGANVGVTLELIAAQIISLEAYQGGGSAFGAVEGGTYVASNETDTQGESDSEEATEESGDY